MNIDMAMRALVAERKRRGLRQADIAKHVGVGQQEVSRWESGQFLTLDALCKYADMMGYDVVLGLAPRSS